MKLEILVAFTLIVSVINMAILCTRFYIEPKTTVKQQPKEEKKEEKPNPIDEGFENIMRFSVNGKNGFNGDAKWE